MNNSLINRNTTVLVLVILILGFIYMNLQNNQSMSGGAVDCDLFVPIVKKIIAKDTLYKFTIGSTPGLIVYILLILVLVYLGYNYSKYELTFKKSPFIEGSGFSMLDWAKGGLYNFYLIRNDTYFYKDTNAPGASGKTTPAKQKEFLDLVATLRTPAFKPTVDNFCSAIQPCSKITPCGCKGATACPSNNNDVQQFTNIEHFGTLSASKRDRAHKLTTASQFFAIIPRCCCVLTKKLSSGDDNPNYYTNLGLTGPEKLGCSTGGETVDALNATIKESARAPGSSTKSVSGDDVQPADLLDADDPCSKVDCAGEPDYKPLTKEVFDLKTGRLTAEHLENSKNIQKAIIANTPAATIAKAFQNSTYNNGPSAAELGAVLTVNNLINQNANTTIDTTLLDVPYTNLISDEIKVKADPKTNVAFKEPPPPPGSNPNGYTSKMHKSAKIKKNKK